MINVVKLCAMLTVVMLITMLTIAKLVAMLLLVMCSAYTKFCTKMDFLGLEIVSGDVG